MTDLRDDLARATATVETVIKASPLRAAGRGRGTSRRWFLFVPLLLAVAGLAGLAFWLASGLTLEQDPPGPVAKVLPAPAQAARRKAVVDLRTQPANAEVYRKDQPGKLLGRTPLRIEVLEVGQEISFLFMLAGFQEATREVQVDDVTIVSVALERLAAPPRRPAPSAPPVVRPAATKPAAIKPAAKKPAAKKPAAAAAPVKPRPASKKPRPGKVDPGEEIDPFAQ